MPRQRSLYPLRAATLCVFRLALYGTTDAKTGQRTITRTETQPVGVVLECGHRLNNGGHRPHYNRDRWPCAWCRSEALNAQAEALRLSNLCAGVIARTVVLRQAARHFNGECGSSCPRCFELRQLEAERP